MPHYLYVKKYIYIENAIANTGTSGRCECIANCCNTTSTKNELQLSLQISMQLIWQYLQLKINFLPYKINKKKDSSGI